MTRFSKHCLGYAWVAAGSLLGLGCDPAPLPDPCAPPPGTTVAQGDVCATNPVQWQTPTVSLSADDFWIVANGKRYTARGATVDIHSDPGGPSYTTLELIWQESDREMRFFLYFSATPTGWQVDEMRTYNGQANADWLFYEGPFFRSPVGATFRGDVDLTNDPNDALRGELHLHGLRLTTTLTGE